MIRLLIADDHEVVRAGLELLVGTFDDVELVAVASDGAEAVSLCEASGPDVALIDIEMPSMGGLEATRRIRAACPDTAVIVFTSLRRGASGARGDRRGGLRIPPQGCGTSRSTPSHQGGRAGRSTLAPRIARLLADGATSAAQARTLPREREVLVLLTDGFANKQIARRLGISEKTVKGHLTNIFRAIGVNDRTQAALWAERQSSEGSEVVA